MMADTTTPTIPLGPYAVITKSEQFSEDFWFTLQDNDRILMELDESLDHFLGRWVSVEEVVKAIRAGEIELVREN